MVVCAKCKQVLPAGAKACRSCGEPYRAVVKNKDLLKPKMSLDDVVQKTNTDVARSKLPLRTIFLFSVLALLAVAVIFLAQSARVIFDGSGEEYRQKIFYDPVFGLMWSKAKTEPMLYEEAERYCKDLRIGKMNDWRLPTITELRSIVKGCPATVVKGKCTVQDTCYMPECRKDECKGCEEGGGTGEESLYWQPKIWEHTKGWSKGVYWSATERKEMIDSPDAGTDRTAWTVSFLTGGIEGKSIEMWGHARCVSGPVPVTDRIRQYFIFMK